MESQLMFTPLATRQSRWRSFLIGWGLQAQLVLAVLLLNAMFPKHIQQAKKYVATNLLTPFEPVTNEAQSANARLVVRPLPQHVTETPPASKLVVHRQVPDIRYPEPDVKAPEIRLMSKTPNLPRLPDVPIAKVVATNTFATPTNVTATTTKLAVQVQTAEFGDPNGIPAIA